MKLTDLAKKIISEDTWGNNPSSAGGMSPGRSPTATPPPATPNLKVVNVGGAYKAFKNQLEQQKNAATKKFAEDLKKQFLGKPTVIKASKGSVGQIEKEYNVTVNNIEVRYMKDKYYVVFIGKEGKESENEYYLEDPAVKIDDSAPQVSGTGATGGQEPVSNPFTGNTKRNILPQK